MVSDAFGASVQVSQLFSSQGFGTRDHLQIIHRFDSIRTITS